MPTLGGYYCVEWHILEVFQADFCNWKSMGITLCDACLAITKFKTNGSLASENRPTWKEEEKRIEKIINQQLIVGSSFN